MALVFPVPGGTVIQGEHPTGGLSGYPALDIGAAPGSPVLAPESGTVQRLSGHDPALGVVEPKAGVFGWTEYFHGDSGRDYYLTHLGSRLPAGTHVGAGQWLGSVGDFPDWRAPDHLHIGIAGDPGITRLLTTARAGSLPSPPRTASGGQSCSAGKVWVPSLGKCMPRCTLLQTGEQGYLDGGKCVVPSGNSTPGPPSVSDQLGIGGIVDAIRFLTSIRFLQLLGGGLLLMIGLWLLAKQAGVSVPKPPLAQTVTSTLG